MQETEQTIRRFIAKEIMFNDDETALELDYPLLQGGAIDSMDLHRLVVFLEEEYDVTIDDESVRPEYFENVRTIAGLVDRLRGGG